MAEFSRKRKADCFASDTAEPEAKKGKTLYETTIAAPFRRARRSLVCMHKVGQPCTGRHCSYASHVQEDAVYLLSYLLAIPSHVVTQTIALASTQVFQPIWSRANAQDPAAAPHASTDLAGDATLPSLDPVAAEAAAAAAQTPQKGHLLRAASPLLEEMLESPVTASKPAPEAASSSPGRHTLYQDAPVSSSSHQQGLPCPLPRAMLPGDGNNATSTGGLAVLGSAAGSDSCRQDVPQTVDKGTAPQCSMSGNATDPTGVTAAIGSDTCFSLSPAAKLRSHAAEASSKSGSQGNASVAIANDVAVSGAAARCCSGSGTHTPVASVSLGGLLDSAQAVTGADAAVDPSRGCLEAVGQDTAEQQVAQQQPGKHLLGNCAS